MLARILNDIRALREAAQRFLQALTMTQRERRLAAIIKDLEKRLRGYFGEQWRLFMSQLDAVKDTYPVHEALTHDYYAEWWWEYNDWEAMLARAQASTMRALIRPIDEAVSAAYLIGGRSFIADMGLTLSFNLSNPRAAAYLDQYGARLVTHIDEATRGFIRDVLANGRREGWGYDQMAKAITERYADFAVGRPQAHIQSRAHLIAVHETGQAYGQAAYDQAMEMAEDGLEMEKMWIGAGDACEEICLPNIAVGWIPANEPFPSDDDKAPGHVACRCDTLYQRMKVGEREA